MKKIISLLLALLSCGVFAAAVSAEAEPQSTQPDAAISDSTAQPTTVPTAAAEAFTGTVKITHDNLPVNTDLVVTIGVEGGTLTEGDAIRYRLYDASVSGSDAAAQWLDYTGPAAIAQNTTIEAAVFFADGSRSASAVSQITCIDKNAPLPPEIQASTTEWTKNPVTVTVTGGSDEQSGLMRLEYRIGTDGAWAEYTDKVSLSSAGKVYARSVDMAGNVYTVEGEEIHTIKVEPFAPIALGVDFINGNTVDGDAVRQRLETGNHAAGDMILI